MSLHYPPATGKIGSYSALVGGGGGYLWSKILEYRVWVHPQSGDDYYRPFATFRDAFDFHEAKKAQGSSAHVEMPIALVLQKKGQWVSWSDKNVISVGKKDRTTEWKAEWLKDNKYTPARLKRKLAQAKREAAK